MPDGGNKPLDAVPGVGYGMSMSNATAAMILKRAGILSDRTWRYLGFTGGDHRFMVAGNYFSVDLCLGTWRETA